VQPSATALSQSKQESSPNSNTNDLPESVASTSCANTADNVPIPDYSESQLSVSASSSDSAPTGHCYTADNMPLPNYSERVISVLNPQNVLMELDRMVEETAYHVLSHGDINSRDGYEVYGRRLHAKYPCIAFPVL